MLQNRCQSHAMSCRMSLCQQNIEKLSDQHAKMIKCGIVLQNICQCRHPYVKLGVYVTYNSKKYLRLVARLAIHRSGLCQGSPPFDKTLPTFQLCFADAMWIVCIIYIGNAKAPWQRQSLVGILGQHETTPPGTPISNFASSFLG